MFLLSSSARSEDDPDACPDLEAAAANTAATANIAMHPVTGAFANPSHETAFAAQLFRMAFPCHLFLISLTDAMIIWSSLSAPPDLWPLESMIAFLGTLCLVGRVLVHRKYTHTRASVESTMAHQSMDDTVRGQRLGSWTWIAILALVVSIDLIGYVVAPAADCAFQRTHNLGGFAGLTIALVNGSYGLGFWRKLGLIGIYMLHDGVCSDMFSESLLVVGVVVAHMAEMHLRHIYVEKQRQAEDKQRLEERTDEESRRLEERMEQLQAEKERLLYDVQRRGRPLDDDDDRSAIRRGLQAKPSRQPPTSDGDTTSSDRSGAKPSPDSPPPSLPPGPPSSASSGTTAPPYTWAKPTAPPPTVAELVARQEVAHVLLSCARGQTSHQCQSASVAGAACSGVAATRIVPSAASIPLVAPRHQWHALSGDGFTAAPTPSVASTHTPTSSVAAAAASHELTGSLGCSQSNTNCLMASNGEPTPEQALLVARRDILVSQDQIHVHRVVRTLGMALGATRLEVGTLRALHAVLLQQARPGMNDMEAYRSTGASKSNFQKWRRRVEVAQPRSTL